MCHKWDFTHGIGRKFICKDRGGGGQPFYLYTVKIGDFHQILMSSLILDSLKSKDMLLHSKTVYRFIFVSCLLCLQYQGCSLCCKHHHHAVYKKFICNKMGNADVTISDVSMLALVQLKQLDVASNCLQMYIQYCS